MVDLFMHEYMLLFVMLILVVNMMCLVSNFTTIYIGNKSASMYKPKIVPSIFMLVSSSILFPIMFYENGAMDDFFVFIPAIITNIITFLYGLDGVNYNLKEKDSTPDD